MAQQAKPKLFIGSSREAKRYATAVQRELRRHAEVTPWFTGTFEVNNATMDDLENQVDISDYGVFILSPDDVIDIRGKVMLAPRDNVLFELGLFWGKLRRDRVFFLVPDKAGRQYGDQMITEFHIPTDLQGLTQLDYEIRTDGKYDAAVNPACDTIIGKIEKLGEYQSPIQSSILNFLVQFSKNVISEPDKKYEFLYDAIRSSYNTDFTGHKVSGAAVWKVEGNDGIKQVAGNVGRNRFYPFSANEGKAKDEQRINVVEAYLTRTIQAGLYKTHVANEYLLCYPVGKELALTVHLSGKKATSQDLDRIMDDNTPLLDTINYLFGGELI